MRMLRFLALGLALALTATATSYAQVVNPNSWAQTAAPLAGYAMQIPSNASLSILTSTSATACTSLESNGLGKLVALANVATAAQTVTLSLYDEGASPACAAADLRYSVILPASSTGLLLLNIPLQNGLAYTLSAAATNSIDIWRL